LRLRAARLTATQQRLLPGSKALYISRASSLWRGARACATRSPHFAAARNSAGNSLRTVSIRISSVSGISRAGRP